MVPSQIRNVRSRCLGIGGRLSTGCMNALSQYVLLSAKTSPPDDAAKLRDEAKTLLNRLAEIDSLRKARYIDMGKSFISVARLWLTN